MKTRLTIVAGAVMLCCLAAPGVRAQVVPVPAPSAREVDSLVDKRTRLQDDLDYFNRRLAAARKSYTEAVRANNAVNMDKWNSEVTALENEVQRIQGQIAELDASIPKTRSVELSGSPGAASNAPAPFSSEPVMPRLPLRTAQEELAKLEEARQAESALARKGPKFEDDSVARQQLRASQAELAKLDETTANTARSLATSTNPAQIQQELDRLNARKAQLEQDVEKARKDLDNWDTRYRQLKEELARMEQDQPRTQFQNLQTELNKITADIAAAQAALKNAQEATWARTPETISTTLTPSTPSTTRRTPTTRRSSLSTAMTSEDAGYDTRVVRRITQKPSPELQRELDRLQNRKDLALRDVDRAQTALNTAQREQALANRVGNPVEMDKWGREVSNAESALRAAQTEVGKIDDDLQSRMRELGKTVVEPSPNAPISPRDELNVTVAEDETLNGIYQVKSAGYISMPRGIRVNVAGKSVSDAEQLIKETLEGRELKIATVTVERTRPDLGFASDEEIPTQLRGQVGQMEIPDRAPDVIYLAGEFNNPGPLRIPPGVNPTLLTIVLRSGGLTPSADLQKVKLLHFDAGQSRGSVEEINVQGILQGIGTPVDLQLTPGDIVFVPGFTPVVYVTGNVMRPGALRLFQDEPITAYSAILRSGGFSRFANTKKVSVMRDLGNGEKAAIPINIKDIQQGRQPDVVLQGRDIVFVPEAFFSF